MADGGGFVPRKKTLLSDQKLTLSAPAVAGGKKRPTMKFDIFKNNPQINVYTNVEGDKDNGVIRASMDINTFYVVIEAVKMCINSPTPIKYVIENMTRGKGQDKELKLVSKTIIGRDEKSIFLSVMSADESRPKIKFAFGQSYYHKISTAGGQPLTDIEISCMVAKAWTSYMDELMATLMADNFTEEEPYDWKSKKQGGGSNNYQQKEAPKASSGFDDDFQF